MRKTRTLEPDYFEDLYRSDPDPWRFASSPYEAEKYARTLAALGPDRVRSALEVGCSIGVLTEQLAARCDRLVATEASPTALDLARRRCAGATNIDFRLQPSPHAPLGGPFDVILLSEVVYYWDDADLADFAGAFERVLAPRGRFILVHWLGETDYPKTADEAVNAFRAALEGAYSAERVERTADYRLDVWRGR